MSQTETLEDVRARNPAVDESLADFKVAPVGGALIQSFGQQIDYAKYMSRGAVAIPEHLRGNPGACLAVVDIAVRFGFSPYMTANQTYVQNGRLCFMSQLVHSMIECSGILQKRLRAEYTGTGDDRRCKIVGLLKGETEPHEFLSNRIVDLIPELVTKIVDGKEKKYCKGSPLWLEKPDLQLFYNASRDWARQWAPEVLMGIYTPDEVEQYDTFGGTARDEGPLHDRLAATSPAGTEGSHPAKMADEIDQIVAGATGQGEAVDAGPAAGSQTAGQGGERTDDAGAKPAGGKKAARKAKDPEPAADPPKQVVLPPKPKKIKDWDPYARAYIDAAQSSAELEKWWADDRKLRNDLGVTAEERQPIEALKIDKVIELKGAGK